MADTRTFSFSGSFEIISFTKLLSGVDGMTEPAPFPEGSNITLFTVTIDDEGATVVFPSTVSDDDLLTAVNSYDYDAEMQAIQQQDLLDRRADKCSEIKKVLSDTTDQWVLRAYEEGIVMPPERTAYREMLRELLLQVQISNTPEEIEIPSPPLWVPNMTSNS